MINYKIIGRSNIGNALKGFLVEDNRFLINEDSPELIFLVGSKESIENFKREEYPNTKIVDVSSHQRLRSSTTIVESGNDILYGAHTVTNKNDYKMFNYVANPGCSAIGSITAIYPVMEFLEKNYILDVKFSKSSLTRHSSFNGEKDIMTVVHAFKHTHQKEVNYFFGNNINVKMVPSIIDVPNGIAINIHCFRNNVESEETEFIFSSLKSFYRWNKDIIISNKRPIELKDVIGTNKIGIYIKEDGDNVLINVVLDNLTVGGAYTAYKNAILLMGVE